MKILGSLFGFGISARGMSIQRKKMELIAQNIANADTIRTENGEPYQRKYLKVQEEKSNFATKLAIEGQILKLNTTDENHFRGIKTHNVSLPAVDDNINVSELSDEKPGEVVYMPDHPDADENGYVQMSNVNVINEMVDMIAATRAYEANLTALNASKQMVKDSLEI